MGQIPGMVHLVSEVEDVERLQVRNPEKVAYVTQTTLSVDDTRDVIQDHRCIARDQFPQNKLSDRYIVLQDRISKISAMQPKIGKLPCAHWLHR